MWGVLSSASDGDRRLVQLFDRKLVFFEIDRIVPMIQTCYITTEVEKLGFQAVVLSIAKLKLRRKSWTLPEKQTTQNLSQKCPNCCLT